MDRKQLIYEAVLDFRQRKARALSLRKNKLKIQMARKRSLKRLASSDKLLKRARKSAIQMLRKRVAGKIGLSYNELSISQKMMIDKKIQKMLPAVGKLAKRLFPKIKKKETERFNSMKQQMSNAIKEEFISEAKFENISGVDSILSKFNAKVYFNPTYLEIIRIISNARSFAGKKELRFLIDVENRNKLYVWDSYDAEHSSIIEHFGILNSDKKKELYSGYLRLENDEYRSNIYKGKTNDYVNDSDDFKRLTESDFEQLKKKSTLFKNIFECFPMYKKALTEAKMHMGDYTVYIDPSFNEVEGLMNRSIYSQVRFIVDLTDKNRLYVWDAYKGDIHIDVFKELKIGDSGDFYNDRMYIRGYIDRSENSISLYDQDRTRSVFNSIPKFKKLVTKYNRLVDESLNESTIELDGYFGTHKVYIDPSFNEFEGLMNKSKRNEVRFMVDLTDKNRFYVWDAYYATHIDVYNKIIDKYEPFGVYNNDKFLSGYVNQKQNIVVFLGKNKKQNRAKFDSIPKFKKIIEKYNSKKAFKMNESLNEAKIDVGFNTVYVNPSFNELQGLINKAKEKEVRFIIDKSDKNAFYVWDAYYSGTHFKMISTLNLGSFNNPDLILGYIDGESSDTFIYNKKEYLNYIKNSPKFKKILDKYPPRKSSLDITNEEKENPCWDGYEMIGTKKKGKKEVPNCVPVDEAKTKKIPNSNPIAKSLSNPIFRKKVEKDKSKYDRKSFKQIVKESGLL